MTRRYVHVFACVTEKEGVDSAKEISLQDPGRALILLDNLGASHVVGYIMDKDRRRGVVEIELSRARAREHRRKNEKQRSM